MDCAKIAVILLSIPLNKQHKPSQDKTRQDKISQDKTRQDTTREDNIRQGKGRQGKTRQDSNKTTTAQPEDNYRTTTGQYNFKTRQSKDETRQG